MYWPCLDSLFSLFETIHFLRNLILIAHGLLKENNPQIFAYMPEVRASQGCQVNKEGLFPLGSSC